jgi:hypothetical protein
MYDTNRDLFLTVHTYQHYPLLHHFPKKEKSNLYTSVLMDSPLKFLHSLSANPQQLVFHLNVLSLTEIFAKQFIYITAYTSTLGFYPLMLSLINKFIIPFLTYL